MSVTIRAIRIHLADDADKKFKQELLGLLRQCFHRFFISNN